MFGNVGPNPEPRDYLVYLRDIDIENINKDGSWEKNALYFSLNKLTIWCLMRQRIVVKVEEKKMGHLLHGH